MGDLTVVTALLYLAGLLLAIGALITIAELVRGPGSLDRVICLDMITALMQGALAVYIAVSRDTTVAVAMVATALLAFVATTAVARFHRRDEPKTATQPERATH